MGAVGDHAHHGIEDRSSQPDNQKHRARLGRRQSEGVGVEIQLQRHHRLEDEVGRHIAEAIAKFFRECKTLAIAAHRYFSLSSPHGETKPLPKAPGTRTLFQFVPGDATPTVIEVNKLYRFTTGFGDRNQEPVRAIIRCGEQP